MSRPDLDGMFADVNGGNVLSDDILKRLRQFSIADRELISRRTGTVTVYFDEEVTAVREAEVSAALKAMPPGYTIKDLNGLNIGCGDRTIDSALLAIDISRYALTQEGGHGAASAQALLAVSDNLPFMENSIDFIVALHMLEHVGNPVTTLRHWLDKIKPGGGIGLILPDWRYSWDARHDEAAYGHKWNAEPDLIQHLWREHLNDMCVLEAMQTYNYKLSFDVVLRKHGEFRPFVLPIGLHAESGAGRSRRGAFLSLDTPYVTV
jgi:SAM-dependent methyltransferase